MGRLQPGAEASPRTGAGIQHSRKEVHPENFYCQPDGNPLMDRSTPCMALLMCQGRKASAILDNSCVYISFAP